MNESQDTGRDALFFGSLEAMAFCCLFLTPLLPAENSAFIWIAIPLLRFVVFSLRVLPLSPHSDKVASVSARTVFRQGWLYQLPFWSAGLLFPLQEGQPTSSVCGLALQCGLFAILALLAKARPPLGSVSIVYLTTFGWLCLWQPLIWWLISAGVGFLLTLAPGLARRPTTALTLSKDQSLALGASWLATWVLPHLCQTAPLSSLLLMGWKFLFLTALVLTLHQRAAQRQMEPELATPAGSLARGWLFRRQSAWWLCPWGAFLALAARTPLDLGVTIVLLLAWWRASSLAAQNWFCDDRPVWWVSAESTLMWAFILTPYKPASLILSTLFAGLVTLRSRRTHTQINLPEQDGLGILEDRMRQELRLTSPAGLSAKVLEESASIELEEDLTATAPAGFRQRLLDRLRQSEEKE